LLAKNQNLSNQVDSLKDTNTRLIDYVKSINKKVGTANSGKEFSEITENNKSSQTLIFSKINNKSLVFCLSSSGKSWYEDLLDDGLKSTYVKSINKKVGTANSGKEFSEITENNKSRKIKEFISKAEAAIGL
jgi:hypothetical protein